MLVVRPCEGGQAPSNSYPRASICCSVDSRNFSCQPRLVHSIEDRVRGIQGKSADILAES